MTESVFSSYTAKVFAHRYEGTLLVDNMAGGRPTDEKVTEGWLKTKLAPSDDLIRQMVAESMVERGITADEAVEQIAQDKHLNGFLRDEQGLYLPGYCLKACLKEAGGIAINAGTLPAKGWGTTSKTFPHWAPEHLIVIDHRLHLGVTSPTGIAQRFVHTFRGNAIQNEEYVENVKIDFTIQTDWEVPEERWATLWLTAEKAGLGASRGQGYGTFTVVKWDKVKQPKVSR